jgi:protoporphyrinogen oxidase
MYGGVRTPQVLEEPDDALARRAEGDVSRTLGLRGEIRTLAIARWQRAVPQPDADHVRRVGVLRERLAPLPPLALAGAYLEGVSLGDSAVCGAGAGRRLAERLCA